VEERDQLLDMVSAGAEWASEMYHRLLVVVSKDGSQDGRCIAEGLGIPCVNIGEKLGEKLLEVPTKRRPLEVAGILGNLLDEVGDDGVLLDHIEILFEASLRVEPLTLLRNLSRRRLIVVMWREAIEAGNLVHGFPGHPEFRSYPARAVTLVQFT
jgi:hypothetical protein